MQASPVDSTSEPFKRSDSNKIIICIYKAQLLSLLNPTKALRFCTHHAMCSQIETPAHDELTHYTVHN